MKKTLAIVFALIGWFALITQLILLLKNRTTSEGEAVVRFFSYFTILTNLLVAIYFTGIGSVRQSGSLMPFEKPGTLTAITVYIIVVGVVYQFALRHLWQPQGLQRLTDELLHSVIPLLVLLFWFLYEKSRSVKYSQILSWIVYPLLYLFFILLRGRYSHFYPYPFVDVLSLGIKKVLVNAGILLLVFTALSALFILIGKSPIKR